MKVLYVVSVLVGWLYLGAIGCALKGDGTAEVQCVGVLDGISCQVTHTGGGQKLRVSWDVEIVCKNGTKVTASGAQVVEPGQTVGYKIPEDRIHNFAAADEALTFSIKNIVVQQAQ